MGGVVAVASRRWPINWPTCCRSAPSRSCGCCSWTLRCTALSRSSYLLDRTARRDDRVRRSPPGGASGGVSQAISNGTAVLLPAMPIALDTCTEQRQCCRCRISHHTPERPGAAWVGAAAARPGRRRRRYRQAVPRRGCRLANVRPDRPVTGRSLSGGQTRQQQPGQARSVPAAPRPARMPRARKQAKAAELCPLGQAEGVQWLQQYVRAGRERTVASGAPWWPAP